MLPRLNFWLGFRLLLCRFRIVRIATTLLGSALALCGELRAAPLIVGAHAAYLQINKVDSGFSLGGSGARVTQMTWGPAGKLYVATNGNGVLRYDYNAVSGALTNRTAVSPINAYGIAFHHDSLNRDVMYLSENDVINRRGFLTRLTDAGGDGLFGEPTDINVRLVNNIPTGSHQVNQLAVRGNSLYLGIGTRSFNGGVENAPQGESAYNGNLARIQNLNAVADALDAAGFGYAGNLTTDITRSEPYSSTATNKLINFATGARNPFGIGIDPDGQAWASNNQRRPGANDAFDSDFSNDVHDQLLTGGLKSDFGFPNANWRTNATATVNGFFNAANAKTSLTFDNLAGAARPNYNPNAPNQTGLGMHASADGYDFSSTNSLPVQYHRDLFLARFNADKNIKEAAPGTDTLEYSDIVSVDSATGAVTLIADGFDDGNPDINLRNWSRPIDVLQDAAGNMLIGTYNDGFYRISKAAAAPVVPAVHSFTWNSNGNGNWTESTRWSTYQSGVNVFPHQWGDQRHAVTISRPTAAVTVTVDRNLTVENLILSEQLTINADKTLAVNSLTLQDQSILNVAGTLTVSDPGGSLNFAANATSGSIGSGSVNVTTQINWGTNSTWLAQAGRVNLNPTIAGNVAAGTMLVTEAPATFNVGGSADPFSQGAMRVELVNNSALFAVTAGNKAVATVSGIGAIRVAAGASFSAEGISQSGLQLLGTNSQVTARTQGGIPGAVILYNLAIANDANLDLNDNDMILFYPGAAPNPAAAATIQGYIDNFYRGSTGVPIIGSSQIIATGGETVIVAFDNGVTGFGDAQTGPFLGQILGDSNLPMNAGFNQVIARYTWGGDYDLNGVVDALDYAIVDANLGSTVSTGGVAGWQWGDGDFDGLVTPLDYSPIDANLGKGGLSAGLIAPIPEPCHLAAGLLAVGGLAAARWRRRNFLAAC